MEKPKVVFRNVYKEYSMLKSNKDKLLDFFLPRKEKKSFFAVKDVSFEVYPGETIGIIGINGSGKSTISNLLAEVIPPTVGEIEIDGETSLIAISVGLNGQLSGLENIHLKCMMHGMTETEIEKIIPKVIEFADIGSFIEQPVKNYSSGMKSRLGFAISVHTNPDIMVVDEALSVGDETFYNKCMDKVNEFKELGKTIFFVSHSVTQMRKISDRVMWIHYGEIKEFGETNKILNNYKAFIKWFKELSSKEQKSYKQKMFENQMVKKPKGKEANIKKQVDKKAIKEQRWFGVQLIIVSIIFLVLSTLMISGTPIRTGWNKVAAFIDLDLQKDKFIENETANEKSMAIPVDKKGHVIKENEYIYADEELINKQTTLDVFSEVDVIEQYDNTFLIMYDDQKGFIDQSSINLMELESTNILIEEILPYTPIKFQKAYLYYLAFLGQDVEEAQEKLLYIQVRETEENLKVLSLPESDVNYYTNEENKIKKIEILLKQEIVGDLLEKVEEKGLKSESGLQFYLKGENYIYSIDTSNQNLIVEKIED